MNELPLDPFIIRAHHATRLNLVLSLGADPDRSFTDRTRKAAKKRKAGYYTDVYGSTDEQAAKFELGAILFIKSFLDLDPEHPVKLAVDQKDGICKACAVGNHCLEKPSDKGDVAYVNAFRRTADALGLGSNVNPITETVTYTSAEPRTITSLMTTARVARTVFSDPNFELRKSRLGTKIVDLLGRNVTKE